AATCSGASSAPTSAPPSAASARPTTRWGRRWCPTKGLAPPTGSTAVAAMGPRAMSDQPPNLACPLPHSPGDRLLLAHGAGARPTRRLIRDVLLAALDNEHLRPLGDAALLPAVDGRLVVTTDGSVVTPLFFPSGDIGKLAVHGAVNDLAVSGAEPLYLT